MHPNLTPVKTLTDLQTLIAESSTRPVLLFKHSFTCGVSAEALDELIDHLNHDQSGTRYGLITVQTDRAVSNEAAARLNVRHQSPQAILLCGGQVVWSASHFRVNADEIRRAIERAPVPTGAGSDR